MESKYLHNLNSLRGIAAILVVTLHFYFFIGPIVPYKSIGFVDKLYLMVDLFFLLSGFIMCYVYKNNFLRKVSPKNYKSFLIARFARIYPLHIITLLSEIIVFAVISYIGTFQLLSPIGKHIYRLDAIPVQLTFLQTIGIYNFDTWNAPAWSLSAEWWAYVLFPFLFIGFKKIGYDKWFGGALIVILGWLCIEFILAPLESFFTFPSDPNHKTLDVNWRFGTLRGIVGFIGGMIIWQTFILQKAKQLLSNDWSFLLISVGCFLVMQLKCYDTIIVSLFSLLILSAAYGNSKVDLFLGWKPLKKLGQWSFSIYIWHMIFINIILHYFITKKGEPAKALTRPLSNFEPWEIWGCFILFLIFICAFANYSHKYIETPTRNWIKKKFG